MYKIHDSFIFYTEEPFGPHWRIQRNLLGPNWIVFWIAVSLPLIVKNAIIEKRKDFLLDIFSPNLSNFFLKRKVS